MPERNPTYRVDESLLREKLHAYKVEIDPAKCNAIEQEVANVRYKKAVKIPEINLRVAVPALLAIILLTVLALNFDSITGVFAPAEESEPPIQQNTEPAPVSAVPVNPPVADTASASVSGPASTVNVAPPVERPAEKKTEPALTIKETDTAVQETTAKKAAPVVAQPPTDSAAKAVGENAQDTAVQKTDEPVKKKKKRRRRRNRDMDELKESTLQPSSSDDEVVVPE